MIASGQCLGYVDLMSPDLATAELRKSSDPAGPLGYIEIRMC